MLEHSRLQPLGSTETCLDQDWRDWTVVPPAAGGPLFVSADDLDGTGILTGIDPCASSYWWMPELLVGANGPEREPLPDRVPAAEEAPEHPLRGPTQATRRMVPRSIAAA